MKHILYFSLVSWHHIKQRPHFLPYYISKDPGFKITHLSVESFGSCILKRLKKQFTKNDLIRSNKFNIRIIKVFPYAQKLNVLKTVNTFLVRKYISDKQWDLIILTQPLQLEYIANWEGPLIYEVMDNYEAFYNKISLKESFKRFESFIVKKALKIVVSSSKLKDKILKDYNINDDKISIIPNAYDPTSLEKYRCNGRERKYEKLILTYIGTINKWINFEFIKKFVKDYPAIFYMVGPIDTGIKKLIKNLKSTFIRFTGAVEHHEIAKYICFSDVLIIPFIINDIVEYVDPVKIYEYLHFKKPIVSSYWDELKKFESFVYFYHHSDYESFKETILEAYKNGMKNVNKVDSFLENNTWECRAKVYVKLLKEILNVR